jgi:hypothetical protein
VLLVKVSTEVDQDCDRGAIDVAGMIDAHDLAGELLVRVFPAGNLVNTATTATWCPPLQQIPGTAGPEDIRAYQVYLTDEKKLAPGSVLIAVAALRFLYKISLKRD